MITPGKRKRKPHDEEEGNLLLARIWKWIWKESGGMLFGLMIAVTTGLIIAFIRPPGSLDPAAQPGFERIIPTVSPTQTRISIPVPWWESNQWMDIQTAAKLRTQENVVYTAFIKSNGAVWYSVDKSVRLNDLWKKANRPATVAITVKDTAITFEYRNHTYSLNVFQPFLFQDDSQLIYIVDLQGQLWSRAFDVGIQESASAVAEDLPVSLNPNRTLSPTY